MEWVCTLPGLYENAVKKWFHLCSENCTLKERKDVNDVCPISGRIFIKFVDSFSNPHNQQQQPPTEPKPVKGKRGRKRLSGDDHQPKRKKSTVMADVYNMNNQNESTRTVHTLLNCVFKAGSKKLFKSIFSKEKDPKMISKEVDDHRQYLMNMNERFVQLYHTKPTFHKIELRTFCLAMLYHLSVDQDVKIDRLTYILPDIGKGQALKDLAESLGLELNAITKAIKITRPEVLQNRISFVY